MVGQVLYLDTNLLSMYIQAGQGHLLFRMGYEVHISTTVKEELKNNFKFQEFQRATPIPVVQDSGIYIGQQSGGELSIQELMRRDAANGITSYFASDDTTAILTQDNGSSIHRINSAELLKNGFKAAPATTPSTARRAATASSAASATTSSTAATRPTISSTISATAMTASTITAPAAPSTRWSSARA